MAIGLRRDDLSNARKMEEFFAGDLAHSSLPHLWLSTACSVAGKLGAAESKNAAGNSAGSQRVHETPSLADASLLLPVERVNPQKPCIAAMAAWQVAAEQ